MNIDELKQQVESAIALFTLVDERNVSFCEGLLASLKEVEQKHLERRADMVKVEEEVERLTQENEQLRALLQSLLATVGAGRHRKLDEIRARLERRVNRLAHTTANQAAVPAEKAESSFPVPDGSIDDIVARIGRTTGNTADQAAEPAAAPTDPPAAPPNA